MIFSYANSLHVLAQIIGLGTISVPCKPKRELSLYKKRVDTCSQLHHLLEMKFEL